MDQNVYSRIKNNEHLLRLDFDRVILKAGLCKLGNVMALNLFEVRPEVGYDFVNQTAIVTVTHVQTL